MKGSTYKRCSCPVERDAKGIRKACKKPHGSWVFVADLGRTSAGKRLQVKRSGFATKNAANQALAELLDQSNKGQVAHDDRQTVATFLTDWLDAKERQGLRPTTVRSYRGHLDTYLIPELGHLRLRDLRPGHVEAVLRAAAEPRPDRRPVGPATVRRIHATLRSALATAKRKRLIGYNPAVDLDLPKATRPTVRPWEAAELGRFLDHAATDRLGALYEVIALTGLRRGEACGLRWQDVDLQRQRLVISQQLVQLGHQVLIGPIKTAAGQDRVVDLDEITIGALLAARLRQDTERAAWGDAWSDTGLVFTREDGTALHPETVTKRFRQLSIAAGLRPVRLHDLRHGQASLMLAAGVPIAVVSKRLGHSSIAITSGTFAHLLEGVGRTAATAAANLVPRAGQATPTQGTCDQSVTNPASEEAPRAPRSDVSAGQRGGPPGDRTQNPRIKSPLLCRLS